MPRPATDFRVEFRGDRGGYTASVRDVSAGGMRVRGPKRLAPGERFGLTLLLPAPHRLSLFAEVRWVKEEAPDRFVIGLKFVHTSDTSQKTRLLVQEIQAGKLGVLRPGGVTRRIPRATP